MALKRVCGTCAHNANGWACEHCKDYDRWMRRDCCDCLHSEERSGDEPCRSCWSDDTSFFPNFEPKDEEKKSKDEATDVPVTCTYQFQTIDGSCSALAHAICVHYEKEYPTDMESALIVLEEFAEHIDAYARAKRKFLEREKTYLEKEG